MKRAISVLGGCLFASILLTGGMSSTSAQSPTEAPPTFSKDIAPIMQESCQGCHRPDSMAPMSFLTYDEVRPWARAIKSRTISREMPPWLVDRNIGIQHFKEDPSLSNDEIALISAWVDAGAPEGNPADMPPPREFPDAYVWNISGGEEPDLVVQLPKENLIKADDPNWWGDFYTDLTEEQRIKAGLIDPVTRQPVDRYVKAAQIMPGPGAIGVVHHMHAYFMQDTDGDGVEEQQHLVEYAVGKNGEIYPDGTGKLMKADARVKFNLHYAADGNDTIDRAQVGIVFYPIGEEPEHTIIVTPTAQNNDDLDIPPGATWVRNDGFEITDSAIRITGFQPHMHNRGKRQCLEAIYPGRGETETLICTDWDFGWHIHYNFEDDVQPVVPKGTILHQISWYDNSAANEWNPDPTNWAGYGRRSSDEMSFVWLGYYKISDEEYEKVVKERMAAHARDTE